MKTKESVAAFGLLLLFVLLWAGCGTKHPPPAELAVPRSPVQSPGAQPPPSGASRAGISQAVQARERETSAPYSGEPDGREAPPEEAPAPRDVGSPFGPWQPTDANTVGQGDHPAQSSMELQPYRELEDWVAAYRAGRHAQIYVGGGDLFLTWRLTCYGEAEYAIEKLYFGANATTEITYSSSVTRGEIHYTFGGDLPGEDYLPLVVWKGYPNEQRQEGTSDWEGEHSLSAIQAQALAAEWFPANVSWLEGAFFQVDSRFTLLGQRFYAVAVYHGEEDRAHSRAGGYVAVSEDGQTLLISNELSGGWTMAADSGAQPVVAEAPGQ